MRRRSIAAAVAGLALALAGVALATFQQHSNISLTATQGGQSSGISALLYSTTKPAGQAPWAAKSVKITFPTGTKFALGAVTACTLTDQQIQSGKACPSASKIGTGTASAVPVSKGKTLGTVGGTANAYVSGAKQMILVVKASGQIVVIHQTTSANVLSITVPKLSVTVAGTTYNVVLTKLQLTVPKKGIGEAALITAGECTGNQFVVKTHFVYTNGQAKDLKSSSFCS